MIQAKLFETGPGKIPVLSLLQPWASLVVMGLKQYETRSWQPRYRGPLLIHASAAVKPADRFRFIEYTGVKDNRELPLGSIIGAVVLEDCNPTDKIAHKFAREFNHQELLFGDYSPGRSSWALSRPIRFKSPVPYKGALSIWDAADPKQYKEPADLMRLELQILYADPAHLPSVYDDLRERIQQTYRSARLGLTYELKNISYNP